MLKKLLFSPARPEAAKIASLPGTRLFPCSALDTREAYLANMRSRFCNERRTTDEEGEQWAVWLAHSVSNGLQDSKLSVATQEADDHQAG